MVCKLHFVSCSLNEDAGDDEYQATTKVTIRRRSVGRVLRARALRRRAARVVVVAMTTTCAPKAARHLAGVSRGRSMLPSTTVAVTGRRRST